MILNLYYYYPCEERDSLEREKYPSLILEK